MPFVIVEMWKGRTREQKRALVKAITDAMVKHAGAKPDQLHIAIHESTKENWSLAGRLTCDPKEETN